MAVTVIGILMLASRPPRQDNSLEIKGQATLILALEDNQQPRIFEGEIVQGMTVLDAIQASTAAGNIRFSYSFDNEKVKLSEINGYDGLSNEEVSIYLNAEKVDTDAINSISIKDGDEIKIDLKK